MKYCHLLTSVAIALLSCLVLGAVSVNSDSASFEEFVGRFGRNYASLEEYAQRKAIFSDNIKRIAELNAAHGKTLHGVTQFADLTQAEFEERVLMRSAKLTDEGEHPVWQARGTAFPKAFDWSGNTSVITPVNDQGECGSGWAFAAAENVESAWALAGHPLTKLSPQQLIDCDNASKGCAGGQIGSALAYMVPVGMESLASYPYTATTGKCNYNSKDVVAKMWGYFKVSRFANETLMSEFLYTMGPFAACVDASQWASYTGGVFPASGCTTNANHCLLAVGYNFTASPPYWILRNSWGDKWGMKGFINLEFGKDACGVALQPYSAIAF